MQSSLNSLVASFRRGLRRRVSGIPAIYLPLRRAFTTREGNVTRDTELVMEGYPRSGNSFAEAAFRLSQSRPVELAHHSHAAAQVIQAARWAIPCVVLVRDPVEAARSLVMSSNGHLSPAATLEEYIQFHRDIYEYRNSYVVASFEQVTSDFGNVVDRINERFGTNFDRFDHTPENVEEAHQLLDRTSVKRGTTSTFSPYSPQRTLSEKTAREAEKAKAREAFATPDLQSLIDAARAEYLQCLKAGDAERATHG